MFGPWRQRWHPTHAVSLPVLLPPFAAAAFCRCIFFVFFV
jgi:hypothetical protein